jgi:hypothetical protein
VHGGRRVHAGDDSRRVRHPDRPLVDLRLSRARLVLDVST